MPALVAAFNDRATLWDYWQKHDEETEWTEKWWFTEADDIRAKDFDLSAGKYRPRSVLQIEHRNPLELLDELKAIEGKILKEIDDLADKLRETVE